VSSFRLPLVASILGHAGVLALLILFAAQVPPVPLPEPIRKSGIEVMLTLPEASPPPEPVAETPPPTPEPPPPPVVEPEPPPPPVAVAKPEPPPPPPKPVVHKPVVKPPPKPARPPPPEPMPAPMPATVAPAAPRQAPVQTAAIPQAMPAPRPAPVVSSNYRGMLSAWLESHKRYPESARSRGEEGRAVLRFRVERSGRVLNYALVGSTGFADLDASIDAMMRGAVLPPFPADMTASDVEVSVTVRFALTH
jgi:periplasmic protein TonB